MTQPYIFRQFDKKEPAYQQALSLRYQIFFQSLSLPQIITVDEDEEDAFHFACLCGNELLAYVRLNIINNGARLSQMAVANAHRGEGLGRRLMQTAEKFISEQRVKKIILNARLEAQKFYERLGYKAKEEVFASEKTGLPHVKMEKLLIYNARTIPPAAKHAPEQTAANPSFLNCWANQADNLM